MNYKRKQKLSGVSRKCSICGSQRRQYGEKEKEKKLRKAEREEFDPVYNSLWTHCGDMVR